MPKQYRLSNSIMRLLCFFYFLACNVMPHQDYLNQHDLYKCIEHLLGTSYASNYVIINIIVTVTYVEYCNTHCAFAIKI